MAQRETARDESKFVKKDRQAVQRLRAEIDEESPNTTVRAQQRDHNRDAARGDWDRSSRHHDEGVEPPAESPGPRPEDQYKDRGKGPVRRP
jgi:hypothetical protein